MKFKINGKTYRVKKKVANTIMIAIIVICVSILAACFLKWDPNAFLKPSDRPNISAEDPNQLTEIGTVIPLTQDAGETYLQQTLFLGDSNTARFLTVPANDGKTFTTKDNTIGVVGMGIDGISTLSCMEFETGRFTMPNAVKILQPRRVILTFGTNNLTGNVANAASFGERYEKQILKVQEAYPDADIIVNSIPPVDQNCVYPNVKMEEIVACNKQILQMCEKNNWKYLNSIEGLSDEATGYALKGYTIQDGLHLSAKGIAALFDYIKTHAYITEDRREKPLKPIPTIIGVPHNLINFNPLNDEEFDEDPSKIETDDGEEIIIDSNLENYVGKKEDELLIAIKKEKYSISKVRKIETKEQVLENLIADLKVDEETKTVSYSVYKLEKTIDKTTDDNLDEVDNKPIKEENDGKDIPSEILLP